MTSQRSMRKAKPPSPSVGDIRDLAHVLGQPADPDGATQHRRGQQLVMDVMAADEAQHRPGQRIAQARGELHPHPAPGARRRVATQPGLGSRRFPSIRRRPDVGQRREAYLTRRQGRLLEVDGRRGGGGGRPGRRRPATGRRRRSRWPSRARRSARSRHRRGRGWRSGSAAA